MSIFSLFLCNAQENLSVSDAVKLTLENNLDIKITENQNEIFKNNASFLNSGYLPKLSTSAGFNKSKQNVEILVSQCLLKMKKLIWSTSGFSGGGEFCPLSL